MQHVTICVNISVHFEVHVEALGNHEDQLTLYARLVFLGHAHHVWRPRCVAQVESTVSHIFWNVGSKERARLYRRSVILVLIVVKRCGEKCCEIDLFSAKGCKLSYQEYTYICLTEDERSWKPLFGQYARHWKWQRSYSNKGNKPEALRPLLCSCPSTAEGFWCDIYCISRRGEISLQFS